MAYGLLTGAALCRGFYVMEWELRPTLRRRVPAECDRYMREMWVLAVTGPYHPKCLFFLTLRQVVLTMCCHDQGVLMFSAGFLIWNVDNIFCRHLTATKNQILLPWSALLEGHGWWHILTGLGETAFLAFQCFP